MADQPQRPTARLGLKGYCAASRFAKKTDAKPVGGRGISAFSTSFLFATFLLAHDSTLLHLPHSWQQKPLGLCHTAATMSL
ncbi:hypothetical protein DND67_26290 [Pseudomonas syringae pv. pisi]|nr:hypothetical protein DND67_26290 [Pseudomonas syringae pv. pisi]